MSRFFVTSADGTRVAAWRGDGSGAPVVICNGLGTPPAAWPDVVSAPDLRVTSWYYRGTAGGSRPADPARIRVEDHVADCLALLDAEGIERAVLACWSVGVNVGIELALRYPDRVAGVLAVAGVPGGTFSAMFGPLGVPRPLRHRAGVAAARLARRISPAFDTFARLTPLTPTTARVIAHSGFLLPGATPERLLPTLAEFREHDFRWYFTLALAAAEHRAVEDLARIAVPVTLVAGRWDVLTSPVDMARAAASITDAEFRVLDGSHFLPIEFPGEIAAELRALLARCHPA